MTRTDEYDAYECPCQGTGLINDPTLADKQGFNGVGTTLCPFCEGMGTIFVLKGFAPPRYAGAPVGSGHVEASRGSV